MAEDSNPWAPVKAAAEQLKDALNTVAHTSPADVGHNIASGTSFVVHGTLNTLDHFISWVNTKV
jgi:hypothetical protein